jgi:dihydrofolate reductase
MRKLIVNEMLTLDGIMESPEQWSAPYQNEEITKFNQAGMRASDALLLGRVTYEIFATFWPHQTDDKTGIKDYLNNVPKFVFSSTLKKADWVNTTILSGPLVEEITKLKQQPGKDIVVTGSATLAQSLMQANLVDEYQLFVFPVVLGSGKRLFRDGDHTNLKLAESKVFSSGVALLSYRPEMKKSK